MACEYVGVDQEKWGNAPIGYGNTEKARVQSTVQTKKTLSLQDIHHRLIRRL